METLAGGSSERLVDSVARALSPTASLARLVHDLKGLMKMKILIVEDDPSTRTSLRGILENLGHEVTEAKDGESAWEIFQKEEFRIVVTDWVMPGMDGPELCRRIRSVDRPDYTYVLVCSALRGGDLSYLEALDAGADDFGNKPVGQDELAAELSVVERMERLRREVRTLRRILPICVYCKKIRTDEDAWSSIEAYIASRSDVSFSHGYCPDCYESEVVPQLENFPDSE